MKSRFIKTVAPIIVLLSMCLISLWAESRNCPDVGCPTTEGCSAEGKIIDGGPCDWQCTWSGGFVPVDCTVDP